MPLSTLSSLMALLAASAGGVDPEGHTAASGTANQQIASVDPQRFAQQPTVLDGGVRGQIVRFRSRNPVHFREWFNGESGPEASLSGQLFVPPDIPKPPLVIMIPGSGNVGPHHLHQAGLLVSEGFAAFLIDPFHGRAIESTAGDQSQLSWAASVHDIFSAIEAVGNSSQIDSDRIGLLGSSRGGFAIITAMMPQVSQRNLRGGRSILAGFAGYPWCGLQFWHPKMTPGSKLQIFSGNRDDWVSVQQCQGLVHALSQGGGSASIKLLPGAGHAFDRSGVPPTKLPEISRTTRYPTVYIDDNGNFVHPATGRVDARLKEDFFLRQVVDGGFVERGVTIGSTGDQSAIYAAEMIGFFRRELGSARQGGGPQ